MTAGEASLRTDPRAQPFVLGAGPRSVLLLHGFSGTPYEIRPLGEALARLGYRAIGPCIAGHGDTPEALGASGRGPWVDSAREALEGAGAEPVHLVGLSLGAMIAILLARDYGRRVASLTLLAPAARFSPPIRAVFALFRRGPARALIPYIPKDRVGVMDAEQATHAPMLHRIPTRIIRDVLDLIDESLQAARSVRVPTLVAMGGRDSTIDNRAVEKLARSFTPPPVRILRLASSSHLLPVDVERERLCQDVGEFITSRDQLKG